MLGLYGVILGLHWGYIGFWDLGLGYSLACLIGHMSM